ncbi:relaxase/mobilization nuclease domain-containing protein [Lactococcus garvieae]|uniref:relaxase/mobilization nuclease domain-containing protein n=1 Tax=Lactococcus garvieae TaxID=1363 RepID=UPI00324A43E3
MAVVSKIETVKNVIASVKYAKDGKDKTTKEEKCVCMGGYQIDPNNAIYQIRATAKAFGKENQKVQAYSLITSFKGQEVTPEQAVQITKEAWERSTNLMNGDFPCAFYVHGNTDNIHVHQIIGAIDGQTGLKLHQKQMWRLVADKTNEVCKEHDLSIIKEVANERKDRVEFHEMKYSWKTDLKERINQAMDKTLSQINCSIGYFRQSLSDLGVKIHDRNHRVNTQTEFTGNGEAKTEWKNQVIFMYEFVGKDKKKHKLKDYKLGGENYEQAVISADIKKQQLIYGQRESDLSWLTGRGERVEQEQRASRELAKRGQTVENRLASTSQRTNRGYEAGYSHGRSL